MPSRLPSINSDGVGVVASWREEARSAPFAEDAPAVVVGAGDPVEVGTGWCASLSAFGFVERPHPLLGGLLHRFVKACGQLVRG